MRSRASTSTAAPVGARSQVVLDCPSGIGGNLWMAALLGLGADPAALEGLPARLGVPHVRIDWSMDAATSQVEVLGTECTPTTDFDGLRDRVGSAGLADDLRDLALHVLQAREGAEARLLGLELETREFADEDVADTLIDVVGGVVLWAALGRPAVVLRRPVVVGDPPRRSSAELLDGVPYRVGGAALPLTTPTGAALLRAFWSDATVCGEAVRQTEVPGDFSRAANLPPLHAALHRETRRSASSTHRRAP
jgi:uncharacterized protein (DUF111 family)